MYKLTSEVHLLRFQWLLLILSFELIRNKNICILQNSVLPFQFSSFLIFRLFIFLFFSHSFDHQSSLPLPPLFCPFSEEESSLSTFSPPSDPFSLFASVPARPLLGFTWPERSIDSRRQCMRPRPRGICCQGVYHRYAGTAEASLVSKTGREGLSGAQRRRGGTRG